MRMFCLRTGLSTLALALSAGALSMALTGFLFGIGNNVFHIPYVLGLAQMPEFMGDAFYLSLNKFTSIVWPVVRLVSTEENVEQVFFTAQFASRIAAFIGLIVLVRTLGLVQWVGVALLSVAVALSPWMQLVSVVGGHGMLIPYFTHSEVTWPFIFILLAFLLRQQVVYAAATCGILFCINAFVGLWMLWVVFVWGLLRHPALPFKHWGQATLAFTMLALPVVIWIAASISSDAAVAFDYRDYIRFYYLEHFLIEAATASALLTLASLLACAWLAALSFKESQALKHILLGLVLLLLVGAFLPYVLNQRFVFNLHLLRAAGVLQALAVVLVGCASVLRLLRHGNALLQLLGGAALVLLAVGPVSLGSALLLLGMLTWAWLLESRSRQGLRYGSLYLDWLPALALGGLLIVAGFQLHNRKPQHSPLVHDAEWVAIASWVRQSDLHGVFLLPIQEPNSAYFQLLARRRVWVEHKQGAAVMWQPSFYVQWRRRLEEVQALASPEATLAYARQHGIAYLLLNNSNGVCPSGALALQAWAQHVLCASAP